MQTFKKGGANLTNGGANLKKILILRQKLGVKTQFPVKNCMILK